MTKEQTKMPTYQHDYFYNIMAVVSTLFVTILTVFSHEPIGTAIWGIILAIEVARMFKPYPSTTPKELSYVLFTLTIMFTIIDYNAHRIAAAGADIFMGMTNLAWFLESRKFQDYLNDLAAYKNRLRHE